MSAASKACQDIAIEERFVSARVCMAAKQSIHVSSK
jgi:hypothetical protein